MEAMEGALLGANFTRKSVERVKSLILVRRSHKSYFGINMSVHLHKYDFIYIHDQVYPKGIQPCTMKNRHLLKKLQETLYIGQ